MHFKPVLTKSPKSREIAIFSPKRFFSKKIVEKIGQFFGDFLGKNRQKLAGRLQKIVCLKKFRKLRGNDVFWCAEKGNFALLVLFKKVPTPSISATLVINGNVKFLKVTFSFIFHFHPFT